MKEGRDKGRCLNRAGKYTRVLSAAAIDQCALLSKSLFKTTIIIIALLATDDYDDTRPPARPNP